MSKNARNKDKRKGNSDKRKAVESKESEKRKNAENKVEEKRKEVITKEIAKINDIEVKTTEKRPNVDEIKEELQRKDIENEIKNQPENREIASAVVVPVQSVPKVMKHPLNSKWTLYYYRPDKNRAWDECQHKIHDIYTVEEFWSLFNHLKKPSEIPSGGDYSFFKNDIQPMWEDPQNREGGRLTVIHVNPKQSAVADDVWLDLLVFLIGEDFDQTNETCGMVMNSRSYGYKIGVWTSQSDEKVVRNIGQQIKRSMNPRNLDKPITFEVHSETQKNAKVYGKASSKILITI